MPKAKMARKSTTIDMTAMVDLAFLLITFFMLTTKFRPNEAVQVEIPTSVSDTKLPPTDILTITVAPDGRIFFGVDSKNTKISIAHKIAERKGIEFTPEEIHNFSILGDYGVPFANLKQYLGLSSKEQERVQLPGIPADSTNNELAEWIVMARLSNPKLRIAIKGDKDTPYPAIKKVIGTLQDKNVNKFNLITGNEANPNK